jgi:hypothetical protein
VKTIAASQTHTRHTLPLPALMADLVQTTWARRLGWILLIALAWLALINPPVVEEIGVDPSWQAALARFFKMRAQAGVDYIFTFGPLGYLFTPAFDNDLFWLRYFVELLFKLIAAAVLVSAAGRLPNLFCRMAWLAVIIFFLPVSAEGPDALYPDAQYLLLILVIGARLLRARRLSPWSLAGTALLAWLSLIKFTFLLLSAWVVVVAASHYLLAGCKRLSLAVVGVSTGAFIVLWLLVGQALTNIPAFLRGSWETAAGYAQAMALEGGQAETALGLLVLALVILQFALVVRCAPGRAGYLSFCLMAGAALALSWKHGFIRHDAHAFAFFTFAMGAVLMPLMFCRPERWLLFTNQVLVGACIILGTVGIHWSSKTKGDADFAAQMFWSQLKVKWAYVASPEWTRRRLLTLKPPSWEHWQLPKMSAIIGNGSVDLLSSNLSILFVNGLNWRPRPVFQSYSAYTPYLLAANARFFASDRAPEHLIVALSPIDKRFPPTEDCLALEEIFRHYAPVTLEKECVLLKRISSTFAKREAITLIDRRVTFGEEVELPAENAGFQLMFLKFQPTWWGTLRSLVYKPPSIWMTAATTEKGQLRYRIVPALASSGFLINPFLDNYDDLLKVYGKPGPTRVRSVAFQVESDQSCFDDHFQFRLETDPGLVPFQIARPAK